MIDNKLEKILEEKQFRSFWEMFEWLTEVGYGYIDAFGVCLEKFNESGIWSEVAFIKFESSGLIYNGSHHPGGVELSADSMYNTIFKVRIGVITEETKHLKKLFNFYLKAKETDSLYLANGEIREIEMLCKKTVVLDDLPQILYKYIEDTFKNYWGFPIKIETNKGGTQNVNGYERFARIMRNPNEYR